MGKRSRQAVLKNEGPIPFINVNVKIASKALALRLKNVLHELVHSDQTAYVKDRDIGESIRIVDHIVEYTECNEVPGILAFFILLATLIIESIGMYVRTPAVHARLAH